MDIEAGMRVRIKGRGLPDREIDPPTTPPGETVSWVRYFGGLAGAVDAIDVPNREARVRGKDAAGNPYVVWLGWEHLAVEQEV
jgi:hypothetical protein